MPNDPPLNQPGKNKQEEWDRNVPLVEEQRERGPLLVATAPLVITVVVGMVYVGGAITKIGQIYDAGYKPRDVFAAIPIEQHLGRGIVIALAPTVFWLLLIYAANLFSVPAAPKNKQQLEQLEKERKTLVKIMTPIFLPVLAVVIFFGPLSMLARIAVGGLAAAGVYAVVFWYPPILRRTRRAVSWVIVPTFAIAYFGAGAFITPSPLPEARLETNAGATIRGPLLLQADGQWWIGQPHERIAVVAAEDVRTSRIRSRERESEESLNDKLFG